MANKKKDKWKLAVEKREDELLAEFKEYWADSLKVIPKATKTEAAFGFFFCKVAALQVLVMSHNEELQRLAHNELMKSLTKKLVRKKEKRK